MVETSTIISKAEKAATALLLQLPDYMVYHNLSHTKEVVKAAIKMGTFANLSEDEMEILIISAWFHDTGFKVQYEHHEEKSAEIAGQFLDENEIPTEKKEKIISTILSTHVDQKPKTLVENVLNDADFIHLSKKSYFDRLLLLKL